MVEETLRGCTTASFLSVVYIRLITHIKGCQTPSTVNFLHVLRFIHAKLPSLTKLLSDTLLNVFLAIAVDNLANAQAVTQDEKEEQLQLEAMRKKRMEKRRDGWAKARTIPVLIGLGKISHNKNDNDNPFRNMKPVCPSLDHVSPR